MTDMTISLPVETVVNKISEQLRQAMVRNAYLEGALEQAQAQVKELKEQVGPAVTSAPRIKEDPNLLNGQAVVGG